MTGIVITARVGIMAIVRATIITAMVRIGPMVRTGHRATIIVRSGSHSKIARAKTALVPSVRCGKTVRVRTGPFVRTGPVRNAPVVTVNPVLRARMHPKNRP